MVCCIHSSDREIEGHGTSNDSTIVGTHKTMSLAKKLLGWSLRVSTSSPCVL